MDFKKTFRLLGVVSIFCLSQILSVSGQTEQSIERLASTPKPTPSLSEVFAYNVPEPSIPIPAITSDKRQQAYAKLLEGQRHFWTITTRRLRTQAALAMHAAAARQALVKALEINPSLTEAYTTLAELGFELRLNNPAEIERLSKIAVRLDPDNYGAHRLLAAVYTLQSDLPGDDLNRKNADKAIAEWSEVVRLDPRNAEGWAFLSEFYERTGQTEKQIEALRNWGAAAGALDDRFYSSILNGSELTPDAAVVRLGKALVRSGKNGEAVTILSRAVSDKPSSSEAVAALEDALNAASAEDSLKALDALKQAVYANPTNLALVDVLASTQAKSGQLEEAIKTLQSGIEKIGASDKASAAELFFKIGDFYGESNREREAVGAYEKALSVMEIGNLPLQNETEREFASRAIPKIVDIYRQGGKIGEARTAIARLSTLLGKNDPTADEQLVELLRAIGEKPAALSAVRDARRRFPEEPALLRLEATILTEMGRVDEAVEMLRAKIVNKAKQVAVPQSLVADFMAYLTISDLYKQAGRGAEAVASARQGLDLAQSDAMTNLAMLVLATAQNSAGDFRGAESSIREILKKDPTNASALNNLGYFLVERGERLPEAVELIQKALEREPGNASFLDSLGWAYFKKGEFNQAEKHLIEAARRNPASAAIQEHLGDVYDKLGKTEQAKNAWRKALSLSTEPDAMAKIRGKLSDAKKSSK